MSYDIYIGEAVLESSADKEEFFCRWAVKGHSEKQAPSFKGDELTGKGNSRHPGYIQWGDFCRRNNLYEFFFDEDDGLMREHPGCFPLKQEHLEVLEAALKELEKKDSRPAGLDERYIKDYIAQIPEGEETHSYDKVRLIWLVYWVNWALENCKHPAIANH